MKRCKNAHCLRPLRLRDFAEGSSSHLRCGRLSHRNVGCYCIFEFPDRPLPPSLCYLDLRENSCLNVGDLS